MTEKRVRVKEDVYDELRKIAKQHGVSMGDMIKVLMCGYQGVNDETKAALVEDGVIEKLDGSWDRDIKTTMTVNVFTNRVFDLLVGSVQDPRVRDKKSYLEWLALKEYEKWCGV